MRCWSTLNFFGFLPIIFGAFNNQKLSYFVKRIYVLFLITYSGNNQISYEWKFYLLLKHAQFLSTQYQSVSKIIFQLKWLIQKNGVLHVFDMAKLSRIHETKEFRHSCFDPSSRSSLQFLNYFDYIDNHNSSVIH